MRLERDLSGTPTPKGILRGGEYVSIDCVVWGRKRRLLTAFDLNTTPPTLIRCDFPLQDLRSHNAKLPPLYYDELGNIRDANDKNVMAGPLTAAVFSV